MRLYDLDQQCSVVENLEVAEALGTRTRGLIGHDPLHLGQGMLIRPCRWIHTFGMSFPIDVLYVNKRWRIVAVSEDLRPGRIDRPVPQAWFVVELAAGAIRQAGLKVGNRLEIQP
jgi:uncharacterized membrane protein (UPF0127 family)